MIYVLSQYWIFVALAFVLGLFVGWATCGGVEDGRRSDWLGWATAAFLAGVSGQTSASGVPVMINMAGKLGTTTSSARFKDDITALGVDWSARLQALRPVRFVYKSGYDDGTRTPQFGLIAEEVAETMPELVVRDDRGQVQTVRYHFLPPLLLAEVQRLERERASLTATVTAQAAAIAELRAAIATLVARER